MKNALMIFAAFVLSACATTGAPTPEQLRTSSFGSKPSQEGAISTIQKYVAKSLIDPDSLKLSCTKVTKGWVQYNYYQPPLLGYLVICDVNAKNRFGGYAGAKEYTFLFSEDGFHHMTEIRSLGVLTE